MPQEEQPKNIADKIAYIKRISLFDDIKDDQNAMATLSTIMGEKFFKPGTAIISEGASGADMFLLVCGEASVYKSTLEGDAYKVAILKSEPPVFFGEGALLDADSRSATIKADSECHCLVLGRQEFEGFSHEYPQWALPILSRIARVVLARLRKTNEDLSLLYQALVSEIRGS